MKRSSKLAFYFALCATVSATGLQAQYLVTFQGPAIVSQDPTAQYLVTFQGPAIVSQDPTVSFFDPTTLVPGPTTSVPGASQFLSLADGSELYLITNNTGAAITVLYPIAGSAVVDAASQQDIGNFANPLNCGALTPDGSRLVVGENAVHIFDT